MVMISRSEHMALVTKNVQWPDLTPFLESFNKIILQIDGVSPRISKLFCYENRLKNWHKYGTANHDVSKEIEIM